mmetsp:Transcript_11960/g.27970  ORF Transcript_11960/g.27970 Transcript_11960/m.27970 type:complete len:273 (+) Transcript_11960:98-916(+)|eukprot:CAMPEP_0178414454 /NCGR_PEP_ID=MMETSP0689_2-20121128/23044_1 /TAXON_ID=160604 /ORGANISM="Amphidinium massartii, Strain CS-259" /LENGTH=272 /DNA_ID=CAMNT_0020035743 /DNA_START=29 /DNA_END=847 /DNA_ORIENTATION=+
MCSGETWAFTLPADADWHEVYSTPGGILGRCGCVPKCIVLLGRAALLVVWVATTLWSVTEWVEVSDLELKFWFTKLTHWGALLQIMYFALLFVTTYLASSNCGCCSKSTGTPWFVKLTWFFGSMMPSVTLIITVLYWGLIYEDNGNGPDAISVAMHGFNYILVLVDLLFTRQPFYLKHFWSSVLAGFLYSVFTYVYFQLGGTYQDGVSEYIYEAIDWNDAGKTLTVLLGATFVAAPAFHALHWAIVLVRRMTACGKELPKQPQETSTMKASE